MKLKIFNCRRGLSLAQIMVGIAVISVVLIPVTMFISSMSGSQQAVDTRARVLELMNSLMSELTISKHSDYVAYFISAGLTSDDKFGAVASLYNNRLNNQTDFKDKFFPVTSQILENVKKEEVPDFEYEVKIVPKAGYNESKTGEVSEFYPEHTIKLTVAASWTDRTKKPFETKVMSLSRNIVERNAETAWGSNY